MKKQQPTSPVGLQVFLHLGAHKTATTFIQRALRDAAPDLERGGVTVLTPAELRITRSPRDKKMSVSQRYRALHRHLTAVVERTVASPGLSRLVVSEEGLIGSPAGNLKQRDLYGDMVDRLTVLPRMLDAPNVTVMFAIRNYGAFYSSGFTTALRRGRRLSTDGLAEAMITSPRGWVDVLRDLRAVLPRSQLKVWRYEDFAKLKPQVFTDLVGRDLKGPRNKVFQTLSRSAVESLHAELIASLSREELKRMIQDASKANPIDETNPAFSLFDADQSAALDARYDRDWEEVQRLFPDAVLR